MNLGKWKFYFDRMATYATRPVAVMNIATFIIVSGVSWWWVALGVALLAGFMWFDAKYIAPKEFEYMSQINPEWKKLMERQ
jgi:hypothetical protein